MKPYTKYFNNIYFKIFIALIILLYIINQSRSGGDFRIFLGAADLLNQGETCYNVWIPTKGNDACGYSYSPFFATILIPLTYIPEPLPQILWLCLNVFFLFRIWKIIYFFLNDVSLNIPKKRLWVFISLLLSIRFILHNFEMSQMTIFLVYCCLESIMFLYKNKTIKASFLLSLGIIIKILPIVILPYFLYRKKFKAFGFSLFFLTLFLILPSLFFGWEFNLSLLTEWWNTIDPRKSGFIMGQNLNAEGIHSLSGLIPAFFTDTPSTVDSPIKRLIVNINAEQVSLLLNTCRIFLIAFTLYFLRTFPFKKAKSKLHIIWEISYILLIVALIFPHQQKYAFFFMMPASTYVIYYLLISKNNISIITKNKHYFISILMLVFFMLSTLTTDGLIGNYLNDITEYFKTITFASFILITSLALCVPHKLTSRS